MKEQFILVILGKFSLSLEYHQPDFHIVLQFFCFATMILFGADTYFHFNVWRSNTADTNTANPPMPNTGPATVTAPGANAADPAPAPVTAAYPPAVGTTTTVEMKAQY